MTNDPTEIWIRKNTKFQKASKNNICRVCNGKLKSVYGYKFKYKDELLRLKQITGIADLFSDKEFSEAYSKAK